MEDRIDEHAYFTRATKEDGECWFCGYPFDIGDRILVDENLDNIFCGRKCRDDHAIKE